MADDIPSVILNQVIEPSWGNLVANGIDEHEARLDALEPSVTNVNTRLTTAESKITTVEGWSIPVRAWRYADLQPCGFGPHKITFDAAAVWGETNMTYATGGTFTAAQGGIFLVQIQLTYSGSGIVSSVEWRGGDNSVVTSLQPGGPPVMWGAGGSFSFWAIGTLSATVITGGHIQIVRVSSQ